MRITFFICEGIHDIALLGPILLDLGFSHYGEKLAEYSPRVLGQFLLQRLKNRSVQDVRSRKENQPAMDEVPLFQQAYKHKDGSLALFFTAGGDSLQKVTVDGKHPPVQAMMAALVEMADPVLSSPDIRIPPFSIVIFRDADEGSRADKTTRVAETFGEVLKPVLPEIAVLRHGEIQTNAGFRLGCWIFASPNEESGTLESLLKPHLEAHYGQRWVDAGRFLSTHATPDTKLGKKKRPASLLKAQITVSGQPEGPGFSQAVVLRDLLNSKSNSVVHDFLLTAEGVQMRQFLADALTADP